MPDHAEHNQSINYFPPVTICINAGKFLITLILTMVLNLTSSIAMAAELVIISSTGSDFKAGQIVDSSNTIKLVNGATLTLISESGKIIALKGPYSGSLKADVSSAEEGRLIASLKKIITGDKTEAGSLGVMRSIGGPSLPQNPWTINTAKSGKYCIITSKPVVLWRARKLNTSKLVLLNTENGKEVRTVWHAGQSTLFWPRLQPLIDGATYRIDLSGQSSLPKITLAIIPDLPTQAHAAVWMADNGCSKQALQLINSLK
jgi:hypothetical protein